MSIEHYQSGAWRQNADGQIRASSAWRDGLDLHRATDTFPDGPANPPVTEWHLVRRWRSPPPGASHYVTGQALGRSPSLEPVEIIADWDPLPPGHIGEFWTVNIRFYDGFGVQQVAGGWSQAAGTTGYIEIPPETAFGMWSAEFFYSGSGGTGPSSWAYYSF